MYTEISQRKKGNGNGEFTVIFENRTSQRTGGRIPVRGRTSGIIMRFCLYVRRLHDELKTNEWVIYM